MVGYFHYPEYPCLIDGCTNPTEAFQYADYVIMGAGLCVPHRREWDAGQLTVNIPADSGVRSIRLPKPT